jgi:TonB family protein
MNRFQFAFATALALHALAALGMVEYSRAINTSGTLVASVMKMNWEVESAQPSQTVAHAAAKTARKQVAATNKTIAPVTPATQSVEQNGAPNPVIMENYLASIRDRLANAIHLHEPRGAAISQLVLKVAINSSGSVNNPEIEKTSEHSEVDRAVLAAFESILPLAPFPDEWKKSSGSPETITVRIPVVIRPKN